MHGSGFIMPTRVFKRLDLQDAAEKQRLRFEAHEIEAEASGSRRKWDSVRQKASGAMTALEAELRAIGHM